MSDRELIKKLREDQSFLKEARNFRVEKCNSPRFEEFKIKFGESIGYSKKVSRLLIEINELRKSINMKNKQVEKLIKEEEIEKKPKMVSN